jgi:hypothetical protein
MPRINSQGHVALIRATTSAYGGNPYLWTGSWAEIVAYPGCGVHADNRFQPKMELNDNGRIAFQSSGSHDVAVADTSGVIPLGAAPTSLNYAIDINDSNRIAAYSYVSWLNNRIYTSDDPYITYDYDVGPADIIQFRIAYNNNNQIAWKPPSTSTMYRFTPGVGNEAIGSSDYSPFDIDDRGRIIHVRNQNKIMLNNMVIRQSADVWPPSGGYSQPRVSDNGKYVVWTEDAGTYWDLWTLVDGIPTNLTQGAYEDVLSPDVNNNGSIVFASAVNMGSYPYVSDVYLYTSNDTLPIVYNGHFDGETFFGWDIVEDGSAEVTIVAAGAGFAAQLASGSPAGIEQAVDVPTGSATLSFDFDFVTANGTLTVTLGGIQMAALTSTDDTEAGFTHIEIPIDTTPPLGEAGATLAFSVDDASVSTVQVDSIAITSGGTGLVSESTVSPRVIACRSYPNPFTGGTTLQYSLRHSGPVEVSVYDTKGRIVRELFDGEQERGLRTLSWDGMNDTGDFLPSGLYFMRVCTGTEVESRKVLLVR